MLCKFGIENLPANQVISETRTLMGTVINLTIICEDPNTAAAAIDACLNHMSGLENILSRFQPESQLSRLNRYGEFTESHPALLDLVKNSMELSQLTDGAFDITVKPLLDLYQATPGFLPLTSQIDQALKLVDYRKMDLVGQRISFRQPGMSITLDGIAKGFIVMKVCSFSKSMVLIICW